MFHVKHEDICFSLKYKKGVLGRFQILCAPSATSNFSLPFMFPVKQASFHTRRIIMTIIRDLIIFYRVGDKKTYQMCYHLKDTNKPIDKVKIRQAARMIIPVLSQRFQGQKVTIQRMFLRTQTSEPLK